MKKYEEEIKIDDYTLLITYWYKHKHQLPKLQSKFYNFDIIRNRNNILILSFESKEKYENMEDTTNSSITFVDRLFEWVLDDCIESEWSIIFTIKELYNTNNSCIVIPLKHEYHCSFIPNYFLINDSFKEKFV